MRNNRSVFVCLLALLLAMLGMFALTACNGDDAPELPETTDEQPTTEDVGDVTTGEPEDVTTEEVTTDGATECAHQWVDATCTDPKTCQLCGVTEGAAKGHTEGRVNVEIIE